MLPEDIKSIEFSPEKLEKVMTDKGFTQAKLNDITGFKHFNAVNKIINRSRQATATELLRISKALEVPAETFANK